MKEDLSALVEKIGRSDMLSTAYDTAWVARLANVDSELGLQAINWLCSNQLADGSWGAKQSYCYHDRVISTLSAMIALTYHGKRQADKDLITKGLHALEKITDRATKGLSSTKYGATVGFEVIIPTLVAEAESLGIIKQQKERILGRIGEQRAKKLGRIKGKMISKNITLAHSSEMAGVDGQDMLDLEHLQEENGSIACSPSATAYYALQVKAGDEKALKYLHKIRGRDGGVPNVAPFDIFEIVWSLWNLSMMPNYLSLQNALQKHIDFLSTTWDNQNGCAFSSEYSVKDSDETSMVFDTLSRFGIKKAVENVLVYEEKDWFRCFNLEQDPSISANIHILGALREAGYERDHPSVEKILLFLQKRKSSDDGYWEDKWHISPYYTTSHAIIACTDYANEVVSNAVTWMLNKQKPDGSWGLFGSTPEETAYALQALWLWNQKAGKIPAECLHQGKVWLEDHRKHEYNPLWIGKCLYSPKLVIDSAVITALSLVD